MQSCCAQASGMSLHPGHRGPAMPGSSPTAEWPPVQTSYRPTQSQLAPHIETFALGVAGREGSWASVFSPGPS